MNNNKKAPIDTETVLMTLDQLGQTIDIMTSVVGRLRNYISEHHPIETGAAQESLHPSETCSTQRHKTNTYKDIEERLKPISATLH